MIFVGYSDTTHDHDHLNETRIKRTREYQSKQYPSYSRIVSVCLIPDMRNAGIKLTKLNNQYSLLNPDLIETVESTPDTVISLPTGINTRTGNQIRLERQS